MRLHDCFMSLRFDLKGQDGCGDGGSVASYKGHTRIFIVTVLLFILTVMHVSFTVLESEMCLQEEQYWSYRHWML